MKLEEPGLFREWESREVSGADVVGAEERRQRLSVVTGKGGDEGTLQLSEGGAQLKSWPLNSVRLIADLPVSHVYTLN